MNEGLRLGMFLGGLIMAAVPVSLGIGIGIYVFRQYRLQRSAHDPSEPREG